MTNTLIYINNQLADLSPDINIATTFQGWDIANLLKRTVSHTNQIRLPLTLTNQAIYENANNVNSRTRTPYVATSVKIVSGGMEILNNGMGLLRKVDQFFYIEIYESTIAFFDALEGKYVDQLDLGVYGPFDDTYITANRSSYSPSGTPVIDYGRMFSPEQEVLNDEFAIVFEPWENDTISAAQSWTFISTHIGVNLLAVAPFNDSNYLLQPYGFYLNFQYRIVIEFEIIITVGTTTLTLSVEFQDNERSVSQVAGTHGGLGAGTYILDTTATANNNFTHVAIKASQGLGFNQTAKLNKITIIPIGAIDVKAPFYIPVISYLDTINAIFTGVGYTTNFDTTSDDDEWIGGLMLPFSKDTFSYNTRLTDKYNFKASPIGTQSLTVPNATKQLIQFTDVIFNGSAAWYDNTDSFDIPALSFDLRIRLFFRIDVSVTITAGGNPVFSVCNGTTIQNDDAGNPLTETITTNGAHTITFELPLTTIGTGTFSYNLSVYKLAGTSSVVNVLSGYFYSTIDTQPIGRIHGSNLILPDMLQKDFFADFLYRIAGIVKENNNVVTIKPLAGVIDARSTAENWTTKRDGMRPEGIDFLLSGYAQSNFFTDQPSTAEDAQGTLSIDNANMPLEKTLYTSPFVAVAQVLFEGLKIPRVPIFSFKKDATLEVSEEWKPGPRLVWLRPEATTDPTVKYNNVTKTTYNVAVYGDTSAERQATWKYVVDNYYRQLGLSLDYTKLVSRYYTLSALDISLIDTMTLVFDESAYYIVLKISNYIEGKITKVDLLKVS